MLEREKIKEGLRVWLERKARQIPLKRKDGGVGVLVWKFSKRLRLGANTSDQSGNSVAGEETPKKDRVSGLKRFWENIGTA